MWAALIFIYFSVGTFYIDLSHHTSNYLFTIFILEIYCRKLTTILSYLQLSHVLIYIKFALTIIASHFTNIIVNYFNRIMLWASIRIIENKDIFFFNKIIFCKTFLLCWDNYYFLFSSKYLYI